MATVNVTEQNFQELTRQGIVLLDWWAGWCGPCRAFAPVFERASTQHADIVFGKIDTEEQPGLAAAFDVSSIPTLMVIRDGVLLFSRPGALPQAALEQLIAGARAIDMDQVRRELAARAPTDEA